MHCGPELEWISAWEIDYNCADVEKNREQRTEDAFERSGK